jgi:hypothetical protein
MVLLLELLGQKYPAEQTPTGALKPVLLQKAPGVQGVGMLNPLA